MLESESNGFWRPWEPLEKGSRCEEVHDWREKFEEFFGGADDMITLQQKAGKPGEDGTVLVQVLEVPRLFSEVVAARSSSFEGSTVVTIKHTPTSPQ